MTAIFMLNTHIVRIQTVLPMKLSEVVYRRSLFNTTFLNSQSIPYRFPLLVYFSYIPVGAYSIWLFCVHLFPFLRRVESVCFRHLHVLELRLIKFVARPSTTSIGKLVIPFRGISIISSLGWMSESSRIKLVNRSRLRGELRMSIFATDLSSFVVWTCEILRRIYSDE